MEDGPQPVIGWKSLVGFAGWLMLLTGTFTVILGCGNVAGHPCGFSLIERSLIITSAGAILLLAQWVEWGEEDGKRSTPRSRLKKILLYILISPLVAIGLAILIVLGGLG